VVAIVLILVGISLPAVTMVRRAGKQTQCLNNLRQIFTAFTLFSDSHKGVLPDPAAVQESWETQLLPNLQPDAFRCNADEELFPALGSSYDWRDTGDPLSTLAGRRIVEAPSDAVLAFDCLPGWHGKRKMNAVTAAGVASVWDDQKCLENLTRPLRAKAGP
jgi:hypothetical protein